MVLVQLFIIRIASCNRAAPIFFVIIAHRSPPRSYIAPDTLMLMQIAALNIIIQYMVYFPYHNRPQRLPEYFLRNIGYAMKSGREAQRAGLLARLNRFFPFCQTYSSVPLFSSFFTLFSFSDLCLLLPPLLSGAGPPEQSGCGNGANAR